MGSTLHTSRYIKSPAYSHFCSAHNRFSRQLIKFTPVICCSWGSNWGRYTAPCSAPPAECNWQQLAVSRMNSHLRTQRLGKGNREQHGPPTEAVRTSCVVFIRHSAPLGDVSLLLFLSLILGVAEGMMAKWCGRKWGCLRMSLPGNGNEVDNNKQVIFRWLRVETSELPGMQGLTIMHFSNRFLNMLAHIKYTYEWNSQFKSIKFVEHQLFE